MSMSKECFIRSAESPSSIESNESLQSFGKEARRRGPWGCILTLK